MQEFAPPSLLRPSVMDHSPFRSAGSPAASSPRQANYLLSDLGGEIHDPGRGSASLEFGERTAAGGGDAAAGRAGFGFPGSLRSPSARMFDRGQSFTRPRNLTGTPRSLQQDAAADQPPPMRTSSSSFDMGTVVTTTGLLYAGDTSSASSELSVAAVPFIAHAADDPFFESPSIRNWPPHPASAAQQPRKVLPTPPGLSPPGLGRRDSPHSQFDTALDASSAFDAFKSAGIGASIGAFGSAEARPLGGSNGRIGSHLSRLNLSSDAFGRASPPRHQDGPLLRDGVPNTDLAELNTQSVKMDDLAHSNDIPSDSSPTRSPWQDASSARRIEVQAKPKGGRSSQQPARERRRTETGQETRGSSPLPQASSSAESPLRVVTSVDPRPAAASPSPSQGSSSSDIAAPSREAQSADASSTSKGRRRHPGSSATPSSSSYALAVGSAAATGTLATGGDSRRKAQGMDVVNAADASDVLPAKAPAAREGSKAKLKEAVGDSKSSGKAQPSKKNTSRGVVDKSVAVAAPSAAATGAAAASRRQVYREKQRTGVKDAEKATVEGSLSGGLSTGGSPDVKLYPAKEAAKALTDEAKADAKSRRRRQRDAKELKQLGSMSPSKPASGSVEEVLTAPAQSDASTKSTEAAACTEAKSASFADVVASSKKAQKAAKKEASLEKPPTQAVPTTPMKSKSDVGEVVVKAADGPTVSEGVRQNETLETPAAPTTEPAESKEAAPTTLTDQHEDGAEAGVMDEREESGHAVSNDGSSSDMDKAQLSTDDEFEVVPRHLEDAATSADESFMPAAHTASAREAKRMDKAAKKAAAKEKEQRKEKQKKEKTDRKKSSKSKKDKRSPPTVGGSSMDAAQADDLLAALPIELGAGSAPSVLARLLGGLKNVAMWAGSAVVAAVVAVLTRWKQFVERANLKGGLSTAFAYVESVLAVVFSVVLLLALHGASWFIRIHRVAFRALLSHRHIGFCFAFLYGFPALVHHVFPWAPPWAPVCLWYAFLVQLFCTNGPTAMMTTFRIILPLVFLVEGISHHSFLLDLNGSALCAGACSVTKLTRVCMPMMQEPSFC